MIGEIKMEKLFITLTTKEFKGLSKEAQDEFIYFTTAYHEATHELVGLEVGLKAIAPFKVDTEEMSAIAKIEWRMVWVEEQKSKWAKYQDLLEDVRKYEKRLERIVLSVRESE